MYPEDGAGAGPIGADPVGGFNPIKRFNLEGLVPLILLIIVGIVSLNYFGVINVPFLPGSSEKVNVLFLGIPSLQEANSLDSMKQFLNYQIRDPQSFSDYASEELIQYNVIILDQSNTTDRSLTLAMSDALQKFVQKGGKLVVVLNSGVYRNVQFNNAIASDALGWEVNLGEYSPADCVPNAVGLNACKPGAEISVIGRIKKNDFKNEIMKPFDISPPIGSSPLQLRTLAIQPTSGSTQIAYIDVENSPKTYPAIIVKDNFLGGTVVYFNYDPGATPTIFSRTMQLLK
ncbi:MAG: hypothetical protein PHQ98_02340 [Candidatus ainarchaeum sp.]|nr:hypothetical protein [Candidatus ainarchaeum sp.]